MDSRPALWQEATFGLPWRSCASIKLQIVELSVLRVEELMPLVSALPLLRLEGFSFVSVHAPSRFVRDEEPWVVEQLCLLTTRGYPVVVHPDVILEPERWSTLGSSLVIENMDKRKPVGRTVQELREIFRRLPAARFCFDIGHARQVDPSQKRSPSFWNP